MSAPVLDLEIDTREPLWLRTGVVDRVYKDAPPLGSDLEEWRDTHTAVWVRGRSAGDIRVLTRSLDLATPPEVLAIAERKTVKDFLASMAKDPTKLSDRAKIDRQLDACWEVCPRVILLLEGGWTASKGWMGGRGWHVHAYLGKLLAVQHDRPDLLILPSPTRATTIDIIVALPHLSVLTNPV